MAAITIIIWVVVAVRSDPNLVKEESPQKGGGSPKGGLILPTIHQGKKLPGSQGSQSGVGTGWGHDILLIGLQI